MMRSRSSSRLSSSNNSSDNFVVSSDGSKGRIMESLIDRSASRELNVCGCSIGETGGRMFQVDQSMIESHTLAFVVGDGICKGDWKLIQCGFAFTTLVGKGLWLDREDGGQ